MQHLDEGTIHAWLDGALTADDAARVAQHGRECARCAEMIAEARGLIAGSSRILSALDDVPAVVPRGAGGGQPRPFWSRPAILAAAASVVLMVGSLLVVNNSAVDTGYVGEPTGGSAARPTEGTADAAGRHADTFAASAAEQQRAPARDGRTGSASAPTPMTPRVVPRGGTASGAATRLRAAPGAGGLARNESREMVTPKAPEIVAEKAGGSGKGEPVAPSAPPPADEPSRLADVATTPVSADTVGARLSTETRRAVQRRAAARTRSERAMPSAGAARPTDMVSRADTSYRVRVDTITVTQTDTLTVVVERPGPPNYRDAPIPPAIFRISGCYEVVDGRFPKVVTLTTERIWSGAAEQQFVAKAPGATGYWSQPRSGDVYIALSRAIANARVHPSTGELRGKVHRGGSSERFVARRCR